MYNAELKVRQVKVPVRHGVNRSKGCEWSRLGQGEGQGSGWGQWGVCCQGEVCRQSTLGGTGADGSLGTLFC
jgi:hypothetical protein